MRRDAKRTRPSNILCRLPLRPHYMEGATAYAPLFVVALAGIASGLVLAPLGLAVWFGTNCLFTDRLNWPFDFEACEPLPPLGAAGWALALGWLAIAGLGYVLLFRTCLRRGWVASAGSARLHPGHLFALAAAALTGIMLAALSDAPHITGSERLVTIVSGPVWLRLWWSVRRRAYARLADRAPARACAWTLRILLARQFSVPARDVQVDALAGTGRPSLRAALVVTGPFDAVDARRIADLVDTRLYELAAKIETRTTLPDDEYWRPIVEELGPSGYESPPIPEPASIPAPLLWGLLGAALLTCGFLFRSGDPFSAGDEPLAAAVESVRRDLEQLEAGLDPTKETGVDIDFYLINLRDSKEACPSLGREAMRRWRLVDERHDDRYAYRVHQVSDIDFFGFVVDSVTRTCTREAFGRNLREAQYRVLSLAMPYDWVEIDGRLDWRYVPPRPDDGR